ncbi:unnamed protein product [Cuscuta europaea]|uniref:Uncharacterized protein n=1 Tax=Cuscuta europaea TaxID=41803 RepID=A0A9P0Z2D5_CUSEU|nr:unnamed protein product [Cuscuta europaea]
MPQTWRLIRSLEVLIEKYGLKFSAHDLGYTYDLRTSGKGRFILIVKSGRDPLILGISNANDRGWMTKFFFVERSSLGESGGFLTDNWRTAGEDQKTIPLEFGPQAEEQTVLLLDLGTEARLYSALVTEIKVEGSDKEDDVVSLDEETGMQRAPEGCLSVSLVNPISALPSTAAAASSSTSTRKPLNPLDPTRLSLKRKKVTPPLSPVIKIKHVDACPLPNPSEPMMISARTVPPAELNANFSGDLHCLDKVLEIRKEISPLLLPSTQAAFSGVTLTDMLSASSALLFQGMQVSLAAEERIHDLEGSQAISKQNEEAAEKKLSELNQTKLKLDEKILAQEEVVNRLNDEIKVLDAKLEVQAARIKSLEDYGRRKRQEVIDTVEFYAWQTKKDIMKSFLVGETDKWDPQADIDTWEMYFEGSDPPVGDDGFDLGTCNAEADSGLPNQI